MQSIGSRLVFVLLWTALADAGLSQVNLSTSNGSVQITGHVVDRKGNPLSGVAIYLIPVESQERPPLLWAASRGDGLVSARVPPNNYRFAVLGGVFKIVPASVDARSTTDIDVGKILVHPDVRTRVTRDQIVVDPLVIRDGPPFLIAPPERLSESCGVKFEPFRTVEDFLGGKVRAIRVIRVVRFRGSGKGTPADVQTRVLEMWSGVFRSGSCFIPWAEAPFWCIEATVEYEDGKRTSIWMADAIHVALEDREGRVLFIRLWPSS